MEVTLFESDGTPVAYLAYDDENTFYLWNGKPVAYLESDDQIFGFNGKHLGWYEDGIIWNLDGCKVGYNSKTLPVFAKYEPYKSYKKYKPYISYQNYSKVKPMYTYKQSNITLSQFLIRGSK